MEQTPVIESRDNVSIRSKYLQAAWTWRRTPRCVTGVRVATLVCIGALTWITVAASTGLPDRPSRSQSRDERATNWILSTAERTLDLEPRRDVDLAGVALAVRALASSQSTTGRCDSLRDRLSTLQNASGSFGVNTGSKPLTWLVLGALDDSSRELDVQRAQRARTWLLAAGAASPGAPSSSSTATDATQRALGFLHKARATPTDSAEVDTASLAVYTLAGGPFDMRTAYANALVPAGDAQSRSVYPPASTLLGNSLYTLALNVAVLDHYRTSTEAALLAEASRPALDIAHEVARRFDSASGAWSREPGAAPDLVASACAVLILDTLERWDSARRAQSSDAVAGSSQRHASEMRGCEECHATLSPSQFAQWQGSAHARANVGCAACHGTNHSTIFREAGRVAASTCGECHAQAVRQFASSKHAHAEETLTRSALFAATPPAARASCTACHRIGAKQSEGNVGNCNFCHPSHAFDVRLANEPEACTQCHTGADYPQDEAYRLSKHGAAHAVTRDVNSAPTCVTCHQPGGRHDDGFGITIGGSGAGAVLAGSPTPFPIPAISSEEFALRRSEMVAVCTRCHSSRLAEASLRQADELKREGEAHLLEAAEILRVLNSDGYFGQAQVLALGPLHARPDPQQPGAAVLERFYEMWRFDHAGAWKGAYHQSASVANRASGVGTREDLDFIRAEAERWRAQGAKR